MELEYLYNGRLRKVKLPDDVEVARVSVELPRRDRDELLDNALKNPSGSIGLDNFFVKGRILFIVNDASRPTPTALLLSRLGERIPSGARFIVATGAHKAPTPDELRRILGDSVASNASFIHDCRDDNALYYAGTTSCGTEVFFNSEVEKAGGIFVIGSVEPHYFAGFTGGRKAFLPGISAFSTIEQNHRLALDSRAAPMALEGNPVHEDMDEALDFVRKPIFSLQLVLDAKGRIYAAFAGDIRKSFNAAAREARRIFSVPVESAADIVVCVVNPPLDKNLYQAHKAIEHGKLALADGGIIILVASCSMGIGYDNFMKMLRRYPDFNELSERAMREYSLGDHKAVKIAETAQRAQIWAVTELPDSAFDGTPIRKFAGLQKAIDEALSIKGRDARMLFLGNAGVTVPVLLSQ